MSFEQLYSEDVSSFFRSPVREIFKNVDMDRLISFAGGYPSPDTFPLSEIKDTMCRVIDKYAGKSLQYGATQGVPELRRAIAKRYGTEDERVQITSSSQQGIDVCTRIFIDPGDVILVLDPSYLGALQSFRSYRADIRGIGTYADAGRFGDACTAGIEKAKREGKHVKFIYVIPDFQNPSGETLPFACREILADIAKEHDLMIVEDSPYRELRYEGETLPAIYTLAPDRVLHLGSFSKIFAPGFRLGWIIGHPDILERISVCKQALDLCPPVFDQYVAAEFLESGRLDSNLEKSRELYRTKRDLMLSLLERYMPSGVEWTHPEGGLFLFLTMPPGFDAEKFYEIALKNGVAYVAGSFFSTDGGGKNTMRLNFSFMSPSKIEEGIIRLSGLLKENFEKI